MSQGVFKTGKLLSMGLAATRHVTGVQMARGLSVTSSKASDQKTFKFNQPLSATELMRPGGIASFMRLPIQSTTEGLDAFFVGIPLDIGASNRSGTRHGPRQIRAESPMVRPYNQASGACPFESLNVADIGDVAFNTFNLPEAAKNIRDAYVKMIENGAIPLTLGGDHSITYPILQAIKSRHGPVALIHVDAHADVTLHTYGAQITHGTPFRRAVEEDLIDPKATFQIGLRGSCYSTDPNQWQREQGFTVYLAEDCWYKSMKPIMESIREKIGNKPVYLSFDIDGIDPGFCPGTGTPEIGGLTPIQALEIVRGCRGLNLVGCDLVEVSPPYDFPGTTALTGANLLFEMLCVLPGVKYFK